MVKPISDFTISKVFILWENWYRLPQEIKQKVEIYGSNFSKNNAGISFDLASYRIEELFQNQIVTVMKPPVNASR